MTSAELRETFLHFFKERGHSVVPSDSLIPASDPTVLFTGAGMNQFKGHFLGVKSSLKRAVSAQKCFRTGDVGQVGSTPSHLTFFEMLGNFSFGDYFKEEAIRWAWEFMTEPLRIPPDRLWASVYESDEEAAQIWEKGVGLPRGRVVRFGERENFWPSEAPSKGPNGPCGPCSEIYYDYQRCLVGKRCPDPERCRPGCDCGRFVEIWNLVFTQFDRQPDGTLKDLPAKNIDTGMGLERLAAVVQDKMSVFETDLFQPIITALIESVPEETLTQAITAQRLLANAVADHVRALTFLIADGVVPSNDGRGYVLRMLLRRALRHGRGLGLQKPFLYRLVSVVVKVMQGPYPELVHRRESVAKTVLTEEERFFETLEEKIPLLKEELRLEQMKGGQGRTVLPAEAAARFYDTHGISYEEIVEVCTAQGVLFPSKEEFDRSLIQLQARSKASSKFAGDIFSKDELLSLAHEVAAATRFVGYTALTAQAKVLGIIQAGRLVQAVRAPAKVGVILDQTPFYGEAGGQVGDAGTLVNPSGGKLRVMDTQWVGNVLVHEAQLTEGGLRPGDPLEAAVDPKRRRQVAQNHTATHLLHAVLRRVLGEHVVQAGSLVAPDHLRFDFSHPRGLSPAQRRSIEELANEWVETGLAVRTDQMPLAQARREGALAFFGERYGESVRVVSIGEVSKELCGGTHLQTSQEVGLLIVVEEGAVASGVRRIRALSDQAALAFLKERVALRSGEMARLQKVLGEPASGTDRSAGLEELAGGKGRSGRQLLKVFEATSATQEEAIGTLKERLKERETQQAQARFQQLLDQAKSFKARSLGDVMLFIQQLEGESDHAALRALSDALRKDQPHAVTFLADAQGFCVAASGEFAQKRGIFAHALLKVATEVGGGSGGGRPNLAQGKLGEPSKFQAVQDRLWKHIQTQLEGSR